MTCSYIKWVKITTVAHTIDALVCQQKKMVSLHSPRREVVHFWRYNYDKFFWQLYFNHGKSAVKLFNSCLLSIESFRIESSERHLKIFQSCFCSFQKKELSQQQRQLEMEQLFQVCLLEEKHNNTCETRSFNTRWKIINHKINLLFVLYDCFCG